MADPDVAMLRALYDVRSPRARRRPPLVEFKGTLGDGVPGLMRTRPGANEVVPLTASAPILEDDGGFSILVPAENADRHMRQAIKRLAAETGTEISLAETTPVGQELIFERRWPMVPWVWPRFAAKVALGMAHRAMPVEWHASEAAWKLRGLLRQGTFFQGLTPSDQLSCWPREPSLNDLALELLAPWEHLIAVLPDEHGVVFVLYLFGELLYQLPIVTEMAPSSDNAWLLDWREGTPVNGSLNSIVAELAWRQELFGSTLRLRQFDRPGRTEAVVQGARLETV